jgi:hypothetical protein
MDFISPLIMGVSIKIYDDLTDMNLSQNKLGIEILKSLQTLTTTISVRNDFNFGIVFFIINAFSYLMDREAYTGDYYTSMIILYPILLILAFSTRHYENAISILYVIAFIIFFALEPLLIKEEYSKFKLMIRLITSIVVFVGIFIGYYFGVSSSCLKLGVACLGYIMTSSAFQFYMTFNNDDIQ